MIKLTELSATEIIRQIQAKKITVSQVTEAFIARINEVNSSINAIHQFDQQRILLEAERADKELQLGKHIGRLYGLPITIKDALHVKGFKASKGFPGFLAAASTQDATVVDRLRAEGVIILGMTNVPELLLSYETDNSIYGRTNNPYDLSRTPGGSSGGEAALIATGGSVVGIGTDAGGSVRQPAHYCGIAAHKPTQWLVPFTGNFPFNGAGLPTQLATIAPMARHVEDLILLMDIISGADQIDSHVPPVQFGNPGGVNLKSLRAAYFYGGRAVSPCHDTIQVLNKVVKILTSKVASIVESLPKPFDHVFRLHTETFFYGGDGSIGLKQLYKNTNNKISPLAQKFINLSEKCQFSLTELRQRLIEVEQFRYEMMNFMSHYDVLISPVSATPAKQHGTTYNNIQDFTYVTIHNLTGWPATVIPCGLSQDGLPIGIQIAAKPWDDHICLALAKELQHILGSFPTPKIGGTMSLSVKI
jgi:amidase